MISFEELQLRLRNCKNPLYPTPFERMRIQNAQRCWNGRRTPKWYKKFKQWTDDQKFLNNC